MVGATRVLVKVWPKVGNRARVRDVVSTHPISGLYTDTMSSIVDCHDGILPLFLCVLCSILRRPLRPIVA